MTNNTLATILIQSSRTPDSAKCSLQGFKTFKNVLHIYILCRLHVWCLILMEWKRGSSLPHKFVTLYADKLADWPTADRGTFIYPYKHCLLEHNTGNVIFQAPSWRSLYGKVSRQPYLRCKTSSKELTLYSTFRPKTITTRESNFKQFYPKHPHSYL